MVIIMILYIDVFSYFSHRVLRVFAQAFIYKSLDFPTKFFKDNIHSM
jgi:hypothetical protein